MDKWIAIDAIQKEIRGKDAKLALLWLNKRIHALELQCRGLGQEPRGSTVAMVVDRQGEYDRFYGPVKPGQKRGE
jgi:hypothetical protein